MTFTNLPTLAAQQSFEQVFVERAGKVYSGYQNKAATYSLSRLNLVAGNALLAKIGVTPIDPETGVKLSAASYQGAWDLRDATAGAGGTTLFLNANGTTSCQDRTTLANSACTVTVTNPATGAFTVTGATGTASGTFDFLAGTVTGTYNFTSPTASSGTLVGQRR